MNGIATWSRVALILFLILPETTYCSRDRTRLPESLSEYNNRTLYLEVEIESATGFPEFVEIPSGTVTIGVPQSLSDLESSLTRRYFLFFRSKTSIPLEDIIDMYTPTKVENVSSFNVTKYEITLGDFKKYRDSTGNPIKRALIPATAWISIGSPEVSPTITQFSNFPACWISYCPASGGNGICRSVS